MSGQVQPLAGRKLVAAVRPVLVCLLLLAGLLMIVPSPSNAVAITSIPGTWCDAPKKLRYDYTDAGIYSWVTPGDSSWVPAVDEVITGVDPLGFTITYFGQQYTSMQASDNGVMSLEGMPDTGYIGQQLPSSVAPNTAIGGLWYDWDPSGGEMLSGITGSPGNRVYTFAWIDAAKSPLAPGAKAVSYPPHSFEIKLFEVDSAIEVHVRHSPGNVGAGWNGLGRLIGIESALDGTNGWQGGIYRDLGSLNLDNYGMRFVPIWDAAPVAADDSYSTAAATVLSVAAGTQPGAIAVPADPLKSYISTDGVLVNDKDELPCATKTAVLVDDIPAGEGALTLNDDGSFSYDPEDFCDGSTSFTYEVDDPKGIFQSGAGTAFTSNTATVTIDVGECGGPGNVAPTAVCQISSSAPYATGLPVTFTSAASSDSDGSISARDWDFPGGSPATSSDESEEVTFSAIGTVTAKVRVQDNSATWSSWTDCPAIEVVDGSACPYLMVQFGVTQGPISPGDPVSFVDLSSDGGGATLKTWSWELGDGTTSEQPSLTHIYDAPGDYVIRLTVKDSINCQKTFQVQIRVGIPQGEQPSNEPEQAPAGVPVADAGDDIVVREGQTVQLPGSGSGSSSALSFRWRQISGPTAALTGADTANLQFVAPAPGGSAASAKLVFGLTVIDAGIESGEDIVEVTVAAKTQRPPVAHAGADVTVARGTIVSLDGSGSLDPDGDALTYLWRYPGGAYIASSGGNTASVTLTAPTDPSVSFIDVELTVSDGIVQAADTVRIWLQAPLAASGFKATPQPDGSVLFVANAKASSYVWDFGDGMTYESQQATAAHTYTVAGTYKVTLQSSASADPVAQDVTPTVPAASYTPPATPAPASSFPWPLVLFVAAVAVLAGLFVLAFRHRKGL